MSDEKKSSGEKIETGCGMEMGMGTNYVPCAPQMPVMQTPPMETPMMQAPTVCCPFLMNMQCPMLCGQGMMESDSAMMGMQPVYPQMMNPYMNNPYMFNPCMNNPYMYNPCMFNTAMGMRY